MFQFCGTILGMSFVMITRDLPVWICYPVYLAFIAGTSVFVCYYCEERSTEHGVPNGNA